MFKRALVAFIGIALIAGLVSCGRLTPTKMLGLGGSRNDGQHSVGDNVTVNQVQIRVDKVSALPITKYDKPQHKGEMFVAVDLTLTNKGSQTQTIGNLFLQLNLKDGKGTMGHPTIYSTEGNPPAESLKPGASTSGPIVFTIPKTAKNLQLVFDTSAFTHGTVVWALGDASDIK